MCGLGWDEGRVALQWRRRLWAWELGGGISRECRSLRYAISLQSNSTNQWQWRYDHCGGYSVKGSFEGFYFGLETSSKQATD